MAGKLMPREHEKYGEKLIPKEQEMAGKLTS
jgi:hypothetical protein